MARDLTPDVTNTAWGGEISTIMKGAEGIGPLHDPGHMVQNLLCRWEFYQLKI